MKASRGNIYFGKRRTEAENEHTALVPPTASTELEEEQQSRSAARQDDVHENSSDLKPKLQSRKHLQMSLTNFPVAVANVFNGKRLNSRYMTLSKFVPVDRAALLKTLNDEESIVGSVVDAKEQHEGCFAPIHYLISLLPNSAALYLLRNFLNLNAVDPNTYLQAASEIIATTLGFCWVLTAIFNTSAIFDNPLRKRLGYSDLCVGWDTVPANVVGSIGTSMGAYLAIRFVETNEQRMSLLVSMNKLSVKVQWLGRLSSAFFAVSVACMPIIFVIPPTTSVWGHSIPFMMYILSSAFVVFGRFAMFQDELTRNRVVFLTAYCLLSIIFPTIVISEYIYFAKHEKKSPWPGFVTMLIDYTWFILLSILPYMLPRDVVLVSDIKLGVRESCDFRNSQLSSTSKLSTTSDITHSIPLGVRESCDLRSSQFSTTSKLSTTSDMTYSIPHR